jgi:predicted nucleotidyltransferase
VDRPLLRDVPGGPTELSATYRRPMHPHHQRMVDRLRMHVLADPTVLALLVGGSVARGEARAGSDVDCRVIFTDEEYRRRVAVGDLLLNFSHLAEAPARAAGGEAGDVQLLRDVADRGPEVWRFALKDMLVFSKDREVERLVERGAAYPEHERTEKMASWVSQLPVHHAYLMFGEYSETPYVLAQCAVQIVLFGGRLILAHNRMLYPGRKWFMRQLRRAPEQPEGFLELATALLERPSIATSKAFVDAVEGFAEWPRPPEGAMARFCRDEELAWRTGSPMPGDW